MADDEGDWFGGGDDEPPPAVKPLKKKGDEEEVAPAAEAEGETPAEGEEAAPAEGEKREEAEDEWLDPDKLILFKHWIRPKFLPYKCLYEYRRNYYDDIMEVIASRRRGVRRDIPRAQTFAERMCRLISDPLYKLDKFDRRLDDIKMVTRSEISGSFYKYYTKEQFNRRYSKLLF